MIEARGKLTSVLETWPLDREQINFVKEGLRRIADRDCVRLLSLLDDASESLVLYEQALQERDLKVENESAEYRDDPKLPRIRFRPLGDRVVVRVFETAWRTAGGIVVPDPTDARREGEVAAIGPGGFDFRGKRIAPEIAVGDRVVFGRWSGAEVMIDGEQLVILQVSDVLGVVEREAHDLYWNAMSAKSVA